MQKTSMWWLFLLIFGVTIGGIQSLGWWTKHASAHTRVIPSKGSFDAATAAIRHQKCEPTHWRSMFMQQ